MARTKHQKILLYLVAASIIIQILLVFNWFRDFLTEYSLFLFLIAAFYIFVVCDLLYVIRYYARSIFRTYTATTILSMIFSLPVILGLLLIYSVYNQKKWEVSVFEANGKTYKEIRWYYNSGELYTVQYWSAKDKAPLGVSVTIKDSTRIENVKIDEDKVREFGRFASEHETGDDMVRDSIWLKPEKKWRYH